MLCINGKLAVENLNYFLLKNCILKISVSQSIFIESQQAEY